ncbi:MAG: methyltransferase domain-containing protein [Firmicutes bacterium]|nr:methyltransferase domain-containing protein [Bacillota bacterium]
MSNLIQRTTELAMHIVSDYVGPADIVIDATCGNGHDTLRLAEMGPAAVYAFDLQPEAIEATRDLLAKAGFTCVAEPNTAGPSIVLTCLGHEHMADFFREHAPGPSGDGAEGEDPEGFAAAIIFNLGYLPGGDKSRTTRAQTTLTAVRSSLCMLKKDGILCLTMYSGHPEGTEEKRALLAFAEGLDSKQWHVCYLSMPNQKKQPPEILLISRKK